jgi:scyllo-inositol 2-dehydrogenase (NADP+)
MEDESTAARLTTLQADGSLKTVKLRAPASSYSGYYRQLAEAFAGRAEVPVTPDDALAGIRIIEAAYRSVKERRMVDLD